MALQSGNSGCPGGSRNLMFTGSRRLSVCLLLHLRSLAGFAPTAVVYRDPGNTLEDIQRTKGAINRIWDFPQSSVSTAGLGSGITYAWDPELCANMLPTFREDLEGVSFITCNSLRAAWSRALTALFNIPRGGRRAEPAAIRCA